MTRSAFVATFLLLSVLLVGCTAITSEQLEQYAALRATDVAAAQEIAAARATEAAALANIATVSASLAETLLSATPEAITATLTAPLVMTETSAITETALITETAVVTDTGALAGAATPLATEQPTATPQLALAPTPTPEAEAIAAATPLPTSAPTEAPTPLPTPTLTVSVPVTETVAITTSAPSPAAEAFLRAAGATRVNVRSGPGLAWDRITNIAPGQEYPITGANPDRSWWRILIGDQTGWVSSQVSTVRGNLEAVPVIAPALPDNLSATWSLKWECESPANACKFEACSGQSVATVRKVLNERWLEIERQATWEGECGEPSTWITQADRYVGEERPAPDEGPLFRIFENPANLGAPNRTLNYRGTEVPMWCTEPRTREQDQGDGWTVIFEGEACYDLKSGMLMTMGYFKRWLFTGTYKGKQYERQYFGDYEVYEQVLTDTNVTLSVPTQ